MSVGQRIDMLVIACHRCSQNFNVIAAEWCACVDTSRTLVCPHCGACFCHAPIPYKRSVWERAPRSLRESPQRFGRSQREERHMRGAPVVLIVDDDEAIRSLVACVVEHLGYRMIVTSDPLEAMILAQSSSVEVVISDVLMPNMDGRELCRRIKESPCGAAKRVVLMTSLYRKRRYQDEAFNAFHCDEYLLKPVDVEILAAALHRLAPLPLSGKIRVDAVANG